MSIEALHTMAISILGKNKRYIDGDPLYDILTDEERENIKQISVLIYSGVPITEGICEGCGKIGKLESHHWYEPPSLEYHSVMLCRGCNMKLTTDVVWGLLSGGIACQRWNHVLPRWELQKALVNANNNKEFRKIRGIIKEEYRDYLLPA